MNKKKSTAVILSNPNLDGLAKRLKHRESQIDRICERAVTIAFRAIKLAFDQGDDLIAAKSLCEHGKFQSWVENNFPKSHVTAQRYMRLAEVPKASRMTLLTDYKSLNEIYRLIGVLPAEQTKQLECLPSISIPPEIQKLNWLAEFFVKNPPRPEAMPQVQRDELKAKLRPIVAIYEGL